MMSFMTACSSSDDNISQSIDFTSWKLQSYTMVDDILIPNIDASESYTLRFSDSGFGGKTIADTYGGECTFTNNGDISILNLFHTHAGSGEYFLYLNKVKTYQIKGDKLYLYFENKNQYLLFRRFEEP